MSRPSKKLIRKILLLGSGALKIGEAGEFDYSGSQAIKALKEEGCEIIVVNPNIATYQTSKGLADKVYFLPVDPYFVSKIIAKEKPDGILLSFGGQTALNCGLELYKQGLIKSQISAPKAHPPRAENVKCPQILWTPIEAIKKTEDRDLFVKTLDKIGLLSPRSQAVKTVKDALTAGEKIGYPVILRSAFSLGGQGSAFAKDKKELKQIAAEALAQSTQILIEEDLTGWKEIEYEVVRDKNDNCITVCNMENFDPMGVHTGESIVVAPSQTLTNQEYHGLREISIKLIKHLGIVGECNVQYALRAKNKKSKVKSQIHKLKGKSNNTRIKQYNNITIDYRIIEVNARLSRSSALASKATGYPLAFIAAKLALGYTLPELKNAVTKKTSAFFEPALDYIVVKIPRWDLAKFSLAESKIGSQMKSVGEVMAIGRNFEEALQKASRMVGIDQSGFIASLEKLIHKYPEISLIIKSKNNNSKFHKKLKSLIKQPNEHRLFAIVEGLKNGFSTNDVAKLSGIDKWFLEKIKNIVEIEKALRRLTFKNKNFSVLLAKAKTQGFSDKQIAILIKTSEEKITSLRSKFKIKPKVNQIDTLAAEYPAKTNYLYLTYPTH